MTPVIVTFTGMDGIDPSRLFPLRPIPERYTRWTFDVTGRANDPTPDIRRWLDSKMQARVEFYTVPADTAAWKVVIFFEDDLDAVMFRMHDGDTAFNG